MPAKVKDDVLGKYADRINKTVNEHAHDPIKVGRTPLPAGITNGVAHLKECLIGVVEEGKQNAGEPYWRAMAVVQEPVTAPDGTVVQGAQTTQFRMLGDVVNRNGEVTKTAEENAEWVLQELRKLAPDLEVEGLTLPEVVELVAQDPNVYFKFTTTLGKPSTNIDPATNKPYPPRVWENWNGTKGLEGYTPPDLGKALTNDNSGPADDGQIGRRVNGAVRGAAAPPAKAPPPRANPPAKAPPARPVPKAAPKPQFDETTGDLDSLIKAANGGNNVDPDVQQDAIARLTELALAAGATQKQVDGAKSWDDVAAMCTPSGGQEDNQGEDIDLKKVYSYTPPKAKRPTEVDILDLDHKRRTATVRDINNPKLTYRNVSWSDLSPT